MLTLLIGMLPAILLVSALALYMNHRDQKRKRRSYGEGA